MVVGCSGWEENHLKLFPPFVEYPSQTLLLCPEIFFGFRWKLHFPPRLLLNCLDALSAALKYVFI